MDKEKDKENTNKSRGKLTLKLKLPTSSDPKTRALRSAEKKRINNYSVQVAVKGRKRNIPSDSESNLSDNLNKNEFEARKKAIENFDDTTDIFANKKNEKFLPKINKESLNHDKSKNQDLEPEANINDQEDNQPEAKGNVDTTDKKEILTQSETKYDIDKFNVLSKIKKSIDVDEQKKDERNKVLAERIRLGKEKNKKSKPKKTYQDNIEEKDKFGKSSSKKNKSNFKDQKVNSRRLLQTFIVDDGENDINEYRYRKSKSKKPKVQTKYSKVTKEVILPELITVSDLADRMTEKTGDVVKKLFTMGVAATANQSIDADTAELIVTEFGHIVKRVFDSDVENILDSDNSEAVQQLERAPIVTIMGHVDHGKTSLLDAMRSTDIVGGEFGGITQHIGASYVQTNSGKYITFLDTPGHEAFTEMRSRGANITDIVILVVAADDGVKEQTIEAINHAKAANVPIIVAINKIDKPNSDPDRIKNELLNYEIIAEDLSGDTMFVEVSAKQKLNLDGLEEAILLQAEILELKAPYDCKAQGVVVEAKIDASKGVMTTLLLQRGTLKISDIVVVGTAYGRVRKILDDRGKNIKIATPGIPVEILGLGSVPNAGDQLSVIDEEKKARDIIAYRHKKKREEKNLKNSVKSIDDVFKEAGKGRIKYLPIIIKGDVHGSVEAICNSLTKLNTEEVAIKVIHSATGGINESDISLAAVAGAVIIGFNVRANAGAKELSKDKEVEIRYHSIIYNVVDEIKLLLGGMLDPIKHEEYLGQLEIRQVFKVSGIGKIAGCFVIDGIIKKGAKVRLLRDDVVIHDGILKTLKRFKEDVKEVKNNFECGAAFENYDDIKEGDKVECYEIVEQKRTLDDNKNIDNSVKKKK